MEVTGKAAWRAAALGRARELAVGGGSLRYFDAGGGDPIVLVHGVLSNANIWHEVVRRLSPEFRCVTLDLPLGAHALPMPEADRTPPGVAAMVADALEALELEDATLVGNDTGGAICQLLAGHRPERVGRLVLTSCEVGDNWPPLLFRIMNPLARTPRALGLVGYLAPGLLPGMSRAPVAYGWLAKRPFGRDVVRTFVRPSLVDPRVRADFAAFLRDYGPHHGRAAVAGLRRFERPALVAWSAEDRVMPPTDAQTLAQALPHARTAWIEDAYTLSPWDRPDRVAQLVAEFTREGRVEAPTDAGAAPRGSGHAS